MILDDLNGREVMKFNLNDCVFVKLTDFGRDILEQNHNKFWGGPNAPKFTPPVEKDGWSQWQLWVLMQEFGDYIGLAKGIPFELDIVIPVEKEEAKEFV